MAREGTQKKFVPAEETCRKRERKEGTRQKGLIAKEAHKRRNMIP